MWSTRRKGTGFYVSVAMRILHCADLHIRCSPTSNDRHEEYLRVLRRLVETAGDLAPDACLIAGDVFHSKYKCSARGADLFLWFVRALADLCPVYVLAGNHDFQQEAPDSPDLVTAVLGGSGIPGVHVMNETKVYRLDGGAFSVVTVQDALEGGSTRGHVADLPPFPRDPSARFNVAVFHGPVSYSRLSTGVDLRDGVPSSWFDGFDATLLGDIHLPQVHRATLVERSRLTSRWTWDEGASPWGYSGSTIQQNFGEPIFGHGFMLWDLAKREVSHFHVANDFGFADAYFEPDSGTWRVKVGDDDFLEKGSPSLPRTLQYRVKSAPGRFETKLLETEQIDCSIRVRQVQSPVPDIDVSAYLMSSSHFAEDWRIAEDLSRASFLETGVPPRILDRVAAFRRFSNSVRESSSRTLARFFVKRLSIKNVLCYEDLAVDFAGLGGRVVGLAGPNSSGKSSFIESISIAIFGTGYRSSEGLVRHGSDRAETEVVLGFDGSSECTIRRTFAIKPGTSRSVSRAAEFEREGIVLRKGKVAVDAIVKETFGTLDMFLASSCVTQGNDNDFLDMSRDKRTSYLDGVLGLSTIESTESCLKEAFLIQKNIAEYLDARLEGEKFEDPAPYMDRLERIRSRIEDLTAEENEAEEACKSLQCKPGSRVDVRSAETELSRILEHISSVPLVEVEGRIVKTDRSFAVVLAEYESLGDPPAFSPEYSGDTLPLDYDLTGLPSRSELEAVRSKLESVRGSLISRTDFISLDRDALTSRRDASAKMLACVAGERARLLESKTKLLEDRPEGPGLHPHNPECWACVARMGDTKNLDAQAKTKAYEEWRESLNEVSRELSECESRLEAKSLDLRAAERELYGIERKLVDTGLRLGDTERDLRELARKFVLVENMEYAAWAARERRLRDELFTTSKNEREARDRAAFLEASIAHTRYSEALDRLKSVRRQLGDLRNEALGLEKKIEVLASKNESFRILADAVDREQGKTLSLKRLNEHYRGYKAHLYKTAIGPRICESANELLEGVAPVRVSETDMVFSVNGVSADRAGGFYRAIASIAIRIAISKTCSQMFIDEGFVACDVDNVRNVAPFLRRLLSIFDGVLVCSHIEAIMDETDARWTFCSERVGPTLV